MSKKKNLDLTKPLPIDILGSESDPCFAQFNDPEADECQRCGDCEICAIVQSQNMHLKRSKIESKKQFKDVVKKPIKKIIKKKK